MPWGRKDSGVTNKAAKNEIEAYKKKLANEQERLVKLWEAYAIQEKALKEATDQINELEGRGRSPAKKDETAGGSNSTGLKICKEDLKKEKEKNARLFAVAKELDDEMKQKAKALEIAEKKNEELLMELEFLKDKYQHQDIP